MDSYGNGSYFTLAVKTIADGAQSGGEGNGQPEDTPTLSGILSGNTTTQSTVISWNTGTKLSNSKVSYCSPAPCTNYTSTQRVSSYVTSHSVALGNLNPATTYSFVVNSIDAYGNLATSSEQTFTTLTAQIALSQASQYAGGGGVSSVSFWSEVEQKEKLEKLVKTLETRPDISKDELVVLKQQLDDLKNKSVSKNIYDDLKKQFDVKTSEQQTTISDLQKKLFGVQEGKVENPDELIKSMMQKFRETIGKISGSITLSDTENIVNETNESLLELSKLVPPPVLEGEPQVETTSNSADILWNTNIPTDSLVKYVPIIKGVPSLKDAKTQGKPDFSLNHKIELKNLEPGTDYRLNIISRDGYSNLAIEEISSFRTTKDITPPQISQVKTEMTIFPGKQERVQALIFWQTDEPSTSKIIYSEGPSETRENSFMNETQEDMELTQSHAVIITKWKPGTVYSFKTVSKDNFGNVSYSERFVTVTPKRRENVLDIIIDNFGKTFEWTKKIGL